MKVLAVICRLLPSAIFVVSPFTTARGMHGGGGGFGGHGFASHSFGSHGFSHFGAHRNFGFFHHGFDRDGRFFRDRDDFFFRHRFFVGFDFAAFGFPGWWYPYDWYAYPDAYYGDPYSYNNAPSSYGDDSTPYGTQYWSNLAMSVQTKLAQRGYYHGSIDGVLGPDSQRAIKEFQAANRMHVTGRIDPKLLKSLDISYKV
ncbi:MAG: peptidoglycan-binding protein [Verrucomicrobia bacterium]|nr:peptidoglycan-binding protein [Verrucomicrobiota bacterium]